MTGPVTARLFISSSAPDTDFTVKLIDVHPPIEGDPHGNSALAAVRRLALRSDRAGFSVTLYIRLPDDRRRHRCKS